MLSNFKALVKQKTTILDVVFAIKKGPLSWRRPTFARSAIIGAEGLNFRVRDGIGCVPFAHVTKTMVLLRICLIINCKTILPKRSAQLNAFVVRSTY